MLSEERGSRMNGLRYENDLIFLTRLKPAVVRLSSIVPLYLRVNSGVFTGGECI